MKIKTSKLLNSHIPIEIFLEIKQDNIIEISENEFEETPFSEDQLRFLQKNKKKIKEAAANFLLEKYKNPEIIKKILDKDFIMMNAPSEALAAALKTEQNVIFYGRGGYGKSEMIKTLFSNDLLKDKVFIKSLNESTSEEDLFGGIKMKELMDNGSILYKTENSFINYPIVVFEEMLDADITVLAALKDALSSKEIRNGVQREKVKTKIVIGLTNKEPSGVSKSASTEALIQRFPIIQSMEYPITLDIILLMILKTMKNPEVLSVNDLTKFDVLYNSINNLVPRKIIQIIKFIDSNIEIFNNKTMIADISAEKITAARTSISSNLQSKIKSFKQETKAYIGIGLSEKTRTESTFQIAKYDTYSKLW